jgi:DNA-binding NarL/FixJ family response regulator
MEKIKIIVADSNYLTREGIKALVRENRDFILLGDCDTSAELIAKTEKTKPDVVIIDHASDGFSLRDIEKIKAISINTNLLSITAPLGQLAVANAIEAGTLSYLLKDCDKVEINEAIYATAKGEKFFCGKIIQAVLPADDITVSAISCDGIRVSSREVEIIQLVAEGLSNKQIADKLCISVHTVTTHRKNIMSKLGINNTAGLVLFALKQNIITPNKFLFAGS